MIQAPSREVEDRSQCLKEIEFVGKFDSQNNSSALDAMRNFPFSCQSARATFESKVNIQSSTASLEAAESALESLKVTEQSELPLSGSKDDCVDAVEKQRDARRESLLVQLEALLDRRNFLVIEQRKAAIQAEDAAAGRDGSGIAACGPICLDAQRRADDLENETGELVKAISKLRDDIDNVQRVFDQDLLLCN